MSADKSHDSTATSLEKKQEKESLSIKKTTQETKNSVLAIAEDDDLLLDEGGDFFWLLQNVVWNALKSLFIIFILGAIVWLIWTKSPAGERISQTGSSSQEIKEPSKRELAKAQKEAEKKQKKVKAEKQKKENLKVIQTTNSEHISNPIALPEKEVSSQSVNTSLGKIAKISVDWHTYIDKKRMFSSEKELSESFFWMRDVETLYSIPLPQHFKGSNYTEKKDKISGFLNQVSFLLNNSLRIRTDVYNKQLVYRAEANQAQKQFQEVTNRVNVAVSRREALILPALVSQKAELSRNFTANKAEDEIRQSILLTMERYDKSMRSLYEVVYANQEAIARDIQVVNFPSDPFNRVITPAQWRAK